VGPVKARERCLEWAGIALTSIAYLMRRRVRVGDENQLA